MRKLLQRWRGIPRETKAILVKPCMWGLDTWLLKLFRIPGPHRVWCSLLIPFTIEYYYAVTGELDEHLIALLLAGDMFSGLGLLGEVLYLAHVTACVGIWDSCTGVCHGRDAEVDMLSFCTRFKGIVPKLRKSGLKVPQWYVEQHELDLAKTLEVAGIHLYPRHLLHHPLDSSDLKIRRRITSLHTSSQCYVVSLMSPQKLKRAVQVVEKIAPVWGYMLGFLAKIHSVISAKTEQKTTSSASSEYPQPSPSQSSVEYSQVSDDQSALRSLVERLLSLIGR